MKASNHGETLAKLPGKEIRNEQNFIFLSTILIEERLVGREYLKQIIKIQHHNFEKSHQAGDNQAAFWKHEREVVLEFAKK